MRAVALPLAIAACATAAFALAARDAYPELYTLSLANLDWRERVRSRRGARAAAAPAAPHAKTVRSTARTRLRGALAFVWADAVMFGRRVSPPLAALVAALALAAGAALAATARTGYADRVLGILFGAVPFIYITIASTMGVRLAPVLRMPLFWLGDVPLAARLAAWTFGGFWRDAGVVALAVAGYVAVAREARIPLAVFVAVVGLLALTRAVGLAVFALLPNSLDQRGPGRGAARVAVLRAHRPCRRCRHRRGAHRLAFAVCRRHARRHAYGARRIRAPVRFRGLAPRGARRQPRAQLRAKGVGYVPSSQPRTRAVSSVRLRELVLRKSCLRWNVAVELEIDSDSPISVLDEPRRTSLKTWPSRRLRP